MSDYRACDLIPIVTKLAEKYTSKESSSITYETARRLMGAVLYCLNERDASKEDSDIENAYSDIRSIYVSDTDSEKDVMRAYQQGYDLVIQKVKSAKLLYDKTSEDFHSYQNICYYDTIIRGMPQFFLYYDPKFDPTNHILTLDYPTIKHIDNLSGIDAIYQYLQYIDLEQQFLTVFSDHIILDLLTRYHEDYKELLINISSIVLRNILGSMIIGHKKMFLNFERQDYKKITDYVNQHSKEELEFQLFNLIHILVMKGYEGNSALYEYLKADVEDFCTELKHAIKYDCLHVIFPN